MDELNKAIIKTLYIGNPKRLINLETGSTLVCDLKLSGTDTYIFLSTRSTKTNRDTAVIKFFELNRIMLHPELLVQNSTDDEPDNKYFRLDYYRFPVHFIRNIPEAACIAANRNADLDFRWHYTYSTYRSMYFNDKY